MVHEIRGTVHKMLLNRGDLLSSMNLLFKNLCAIRKMMVFNDIYVWTLWSKLISSNFLNEKDITVMLSDVQFQCYILYQNL